MNLLRHPFVAFVLAALAALLCARAGLAQSPGPAADPTTQFDRAAELLTKDPFAAKSLFAKAATGFETRLAATHSQSDRARVLYNLGVTRQLGSDTARAVLAFRRADLLMPAIPGLDEHLAAARAAAKGEPAPELRGRDANAASLAREWSLSIPQVWLWRSALAAYGIFWALVLVRTLARYASWRPPVSLMLAVAIAGLLPAALLAVDLRREHEARSQAVVLTEIATRLQPDDLVGQPSPAGTLKPGMEVAILEERTGGNGQPWLRVRSLGAPEVLEESAAWIPAPAAERIVPARD
jgi:hypothetical protein